LPEPKEILMLTSGTVVGIVLLCIAAVLLVIALIAWIGTAIEVFDGDLSTLFGAMAFVAALIAAAFPIVGFSVVGWSPDYLAFHPVHGVVQQIASRQISEGKGMSQRYVFTIDGQPYGVDDTRAALVKPGDAVSLNCTREFVWGSTNNGYACNWG
jgi:hypothetical protein